MENVLVTGGAGFIGSNFVRYLLGTAPRVHLVNLDALTYAGSLENLKDISGNPRHTFVKGDICDAELIRQTLHKYHIDTIVHLAAETHVDRSILQPGPFVQTNITGTYTLLEAARKFWLEDEGFSLDEVRFHHVSTDEVFGSLGPGDAPWTESSPYAPNSPYAASKAASDHLVRAYGHTFGLPYTLTNCSNNYGPRQFPEKLIPLMILHAAEGKPLPVYGDGLQIRDWLHVQDHCEAIDLVLRKGLAGSTYNIGGQDQHTNLAIVETLCEIMDEIDPVTLGMPHSRLISFVTDRPGHDRRYALNTEKIKSELGWEPRFNLKQGLLDTVTWYLAHPQWVAAIRQQQEYGGWLQKNYGTR